MRSTKSQSGFALICFLAFVPMLITLFFAFAVGGRALVRQSKMRHLCRTHLLEGQSRAASHIEELTRLNPEAQRLRRQRQLALASIAAASASAPALLPAARAALATVTAQQRALRVRQQLLLHRTRFVWQSTSLRMRDALETVGAQQVQIHRPAIGLVAVPPESLSPDYLATPLSAHLQRHSARWHLAIPAPVASRLSSSGWDADCSATLQQENGKWKPKLSAAK